VPDQETDERRPAFGCQAAVVVEPTARLYARHGFREVGIYREQGRLDGAWVDVTIMEKVLSDRSS
jgi:L-amino acid N-acyltransferase YncA